MRCYIGWLKPGKRLEFRTSIEIEPYAAIYNGCYQAGRGGMHSHGLCSIGSFSYSFSPLPEHLIVGRHCSIGEGLKFLNSQHPIDRVTTGHASWRKSPTIWLALNDVKKAKHAQKPFVITGGKPTPASRTTYGLARTRRSAWVSQSATARSLPLTRSTAARLQRL